MAALLETDRAGRVIAGMEIDGPHTIHVPRFSETDGLGETMARKECFFLRTEHGIPRRDTATEFYVPRWMQNGSKPSYYCLREVVRLLEEQHDQPLAERSAV